MNKTKKPIPYTEDYAKVLSVVHKHENINPDVAALWYGRYAIVRCPDEMVARTVVSQLKRQDHQNEWKIQIKPGRYNKKRRYLKVSFDSTT